ncbi:MAG: hypothetical protein WA894_20975, partial [Candidatus Acidiferrum sp.]
MSKELVISAASHERRVAILEEGQLVEIYIEREKEFALVGSIYKGKVTRVLPGMQSAFVDIGLDGDAFLYVSDVFENLEDYDHGHSHSDQPAAAPSYSPAPSSNVVEVLPGEILAHASSSHDAEVISSEPHSEEASRESFAYESAQQDSHSHEAQPGNTGGPADDEGVGSHLAEAHDDSHSGHGEERQPDSNASAPQNFSPHYNPTQNYAPRSDRGGDRGGQGYSRSGERGGDRSRGKWGRRGGRHRGGRSHVPGGRNLPPSKYASPQGGDSRSNEPRGYENRGNDNRGRDQRGNENRGSQPRGYDNRHQENPRFAAPSSPAAVGEEPILLPGESLAKYRGKPAAAAPPAVEQDFREPQPELDDAAPRISGNLSTSVPSTGPASGPGVPRRFSGGLPRWVLADTASESESAPVSAEENVGTAEDASLSAHGANPPRHDVSPLELPVTADADSVRVREEFRGDPELSEDQTAALSSELVEAKHEETSDHAQADALTREAELDEEEAEEIRAEAERIEEDSATEDLDEAEEDSEDEVEDEAHLDVVEEHASSESGLSEEEAEEVEEHRAADRAEFEANAAHESAEHAAALGDSEHVVLEHSEAEVLEAPSGEAHAESVHIEDDVILLPGETRSPRTAGASREDFPRDSARIGGNPRARFQRPQRSGGGRDRGRGGRPDSRGGRPDRGGDRGGRSGQRFERRGPGGPRHDRGHRSHSGPPRRP